MLIAAQQGRAVSELAQKTACQKTKAGVIEASPSQKATCARLAKRRRRARKSRHVPAALACRECASAAKLSCIPEFVQTLSAWLSASTKLG